MEENTIINNNEINQNNIDYNLDDSKDIIIKHLEIMFNQFSQTKTQLENIKEDSNDIKTKLEETEKDMESFSRVSLLRKMSDQISQKNNEIKMLERRVDTLNLKIKKLQSSNDDQKSKNINDSDDNSNSENSNSENSNSNIDGFKKIYIKNKEYLLDINAEKIYELDNITDCIGKLYVNSKGENQLRKKKIN